MSDAPYRVDLDHDAAFRLAQRGATLLFLDVPPGSVLSINQQVVDRPSRSLDKVETLVCSFGLIAGPMQAFVVGPQFLGVKMLPAGPHFVAFSSVSKQGEVAPPVWFFVHLKAGEIVCRRWDHETELLLPFNDAEEVTAIV